MKTHYRTILLAMIALAIMGCASPENSNSQTKPNDSINASPVAVPKPILPNRKVKLDSRLVEANTKFSFNLFDRLAQAKPNQNIFISPSSVAIALSMTHNGASGDTQKAIAKALELQGIKLEDVNRFNEALQRLLGEGDQQPQPNSADPNAPKSAIKTVDLDIANSLWVRQDVSLKAEFLEKVKEFYQAEIQNLDFNDPNSANVINAWVKRYTRDKIEKIVDRVDNDNLLFLINAVYFKGQWAEPFDKSLTQPRPFTLSDGKKIQHPAMMRSGEYRYYDAPNFQAISLPYGSGRFSMEIFLPKPSSSLGALQKQLNLKNWQDWSNKFSRKSGSIQLPKFKMEYETTLKKVLQDLGMAIAFDRSQADFSNLSEVKAFIGDVKHKTFIDVNEEGTEAAAVTSVEIRTTSARPDEEIPFKMVVDRPFFFTISDRQTGTIIFMGAIQNPSL